VKVKDAIYHSLWAGAAFLVVALVAYIIWLTLLTMGDTQGAEGARGVACVSMVLWSLNFVAMVILTAVAQLQPDKEEQTSER